MFTRIEFAKHLFVAALLAVFCLVVAQPAHAVESMQNESGQVQAGARHMQGHGAQGGPASGSKMMQRSRHQGYGGPASGTMGMISDDDDRCGRRHGTEGMRGMQDMMMSHMMGGRGGMGKMMGRMGADMRCPRMGPHGFNHMARMLDDLDLTEEQWEQVRSLAREKLDRMADLWAQQMKVRFELASLRWDENVDPQQARDLYVRQAETQADMMLASTEYMRQLKSILNEDQLERLESEGF